MVTLFSDARMRRRARRFPIAAHLTYREHGGTAWRQGITINVSRTGILFRADGPPPGTREPLEIVLTLAFSRFAPARHVRCTARVARIAPGDLSWGGRAVAVAIAKYALLGRARS